MTRAFRQFIDAVLPTSCIDCQALGSHICTVCSGQFVFTGHRVSRQDLHGCSATTLNRPAHLLISAIKDDGRTGLIRELSSAIVASLALTRSADCESEFAEALHSRDFSIVSIPTRKGALKRRGFDPVDSLAKLVAKDLGVRVQSGLSLARETRDQRALTLDERAENLQCAMSFRVSGVLSDPVVLLDDVVTTGATLLEGRRAVEAAGIHVVGFVTFAETPSLRDAKR